MRAFSCATMQPTQMCTLGAACNCSWATRQPAVAGFCHCRMRCVADSRGRWRTPQQMHMAKLTQVRKVARRAELQLCKTEVTSALYAARLAHRNARRWTPATAAGSALVHSRLQQRQAPLPPRSSGAPVGCRQHSTSKDAQPMRQDPIQPQPSPALTRVHSRTCPMRGSGRSGGRRLVPEGSKRAAKCVHT